MSPTEKVTQYMNEYDVVPQVEEAVNRAVLKNSTNPLAEVGLALLAGKAAPEVPRPLSLPKQVAKAGGVAAWNAQPSIAQQVKMLDAACTATTVAEALAEARGIMSLGHNLWAYAYLRKLYAKNPNVYYATLAADPALLLPVSFPGALSTLRLHAHRCTAVAPCQPMRDSHATRVLHPGAPGPAQVAYTPTVGEACQKFGKMPFYSRGCYVSIQDRGNVKAVLQEYAEVCGRVQYTAVLQRYE